MGFSKNYWEKNYQDLDEMDGVSNSLEHAKYAKSFFDVEGVSISSIVDLGFGLGHMMKSFHKVFLPYKCFGIEPSSFAYDKVINQKWHINKEIKFKNISLLEWSKLKGKEAKFLDLAICTSVFQYIKEDELEVILVELSKRVKYLYFSVPTKTEFLRQRDELDFVDEWAIHRSKSWYLKKLRPHFSIVSSRILESKVHFDAGNTKLTDLLFRF